MSLQQSVAPELNDIRQAIRANYLADEHEVIHRLIAEAQLSDETRKAISARAAELVRDVRNSARPTIMEKFLAEYGLTTKEGVALMCLAEALLRVPDNLTIQDLIEDKITSGNWGATWQGQVRNDQLGHPGPADDQQPAERFRAPECGGYPS